VVVTEVVSATARSGRRRREDRVVKRILVVGSLDSSSSTSGRERMLED
jgi:hypothetical protein